MSKFEDMTVAELKNAAKDIGLSGYSKMRKQELIDALTSAIPQDGKDPVGRAFDELEQEAVRKTIETGELHIVDRTGSISDEMLSDFEAEVKQVVETVFEREVSEELLSEKPVVFANRAMRRKAAYRAKLAMRHARRNGRHTLISEADWEFAEKVSA